MARKQVLDDALDLARRTAVKRRQRHAARQLGWNFVGKVGSQRTRQLGSQLVEERRRITHLIQPRRHLRTLDPVERIADRDIKQRIQLLVSQPLRIQLL
jgi:hypothetical protein